MATVNNDQFLTVLVESQLLGVSSCASLSEAKLLGDPGEDQQASPQDQEQAKPPTDVLFYLSAWLYSPDKFTCLSLKPHNRHVAASESDYLYIQIKRKACCFSSGSLLGFLPGAAQ